MLKKIISLLVAVSLLFSFSACSKKEKEPDFSETKAICELATLKCYYHNTSELDVKKWGWTPSWFPGNKKAWIEYDGIIKLGIDAGSVRIEPAGTKVKVFVPNATILSTDIDTDSICETISNTGWLTKIKTEERAQAVGKAQDDMKNKAKENSVLLSQATQRAKDIIKGYILNVGNQIGVEYEIEWLNK